MTMRMLRLCLVLAGVSVTAIAQTNKPSAYQLSLQDAIQMTLTNNLDLQIERYNPVVSLYGLNSQYGAYDPTLSASGQHDHNEAGSRLLGGGFSIPGSISDDDSAAAEIK